MNVDELMPDLKVAEHWLGQDLLEAMVVLDQQRQRTLEREG